MIETSLDHKWFTAGVLERNIARRFIGRLGNVGIEHRVVPDEDDLRILVRYHQLDDAIQLCPEIPESTPMPRARFQPGYHRWLRLLVTLPVGAAIGSAIALSSSVHWPHSHSTSAIAAISLAICVEVLYTRKEDH